MDSRTYLRRGTVIAKQMHCLLSMIPAEYVLPGGGPAVLAAALASQQLLLPLPLQQSPPRCRPDMLLFTLL